MLGRRPTFFGEAAPDPALDLAGDLRLQREDIVELAVEILAPDLRAVPGSNQVRTDSNAVTGRPNAGFEQIIGGALRRALALLGQLLSRVRTENDQLRVTS